MNTIPSLQQLCLITLAEAKYHDSDINIPFDGIPSDFINHLFKLCVSDHAVTIRYANCDIPFTLSHRGTINDLAKKIADYFKKPINQVNLSLEKKILKNRLTLCDYGVKIGHPVTLSLKFTKPLSELELLMLQEQEKMNAL